MSQMTHMGRRGTSVISGIPLRAPSDLPEGVHMEVPVPLATDELPAIVERFADVARRLERCGLDGVEVTSYGGHLLEQFFDPLVNTRTDAYGGSLENRTRLAREVLLAVRAAVSESFIVGFRMTLDQCLTGGLGPGEMIEIARSLASTGAVDLFSVSGGTGATRLSTGYFVPGDMLPEGVFNERAIRFRREVGVPTLVAGRNVEPDLAEEALAGGVDLVAMTRALIADPDLPVKVADGRRHRPCIGLNDGCIGRLYTGMPMYCSVNPAVRHPGLGEGRAGRGAGARRGRRGRGGRPGGGAGCRVARTLGRGVRATVRCSAVGRGWRDSDPDASAGIATSTGSARRPSRLGRRSVWVSMRTRTPSLRRSPTRSSSRRGRSFGPRRGYRVPCRCSMSMSCSRAGSSVLPDPAKGSALILDDDGHQLAPTAAEMLVETGFEVEIATTYPSVGALIDATQSPLVLQKLARDGVRLTPNVEGVSSSPGGVVTLRHLYSEQEEQRDGIAIVVVTGRRRGLTTLRDELAVAAPDLPVVVVGDALSPRTLLDATAEGARAGATVGGRARRVRQSIA